MKTVAKRLAFATVTVFTRETIKTGPGTKDRGPKDIAVLHLAFMTEMQLVSVF